MSALALALDQIKRPSWWNENVRVPPAKLVSVETLAKRQEILDYLKAAGKRVDGIVVQRHFGFTNSQLWHYMNPLVEAGKVKKHKPRHDRSMLEAVWP